MSNRKTSSDFFDMVYQVVRLIPRGRVSTYGAIARYLGTARSARMVGWALNGCASVRPMVPAHRVVNRTGMLSGFMHFEEPRLMQQLLKKEGVKVKNNTVQHFERLFWDPNKELEI